MISRLVRESRWLLSRNYTTLLSYIHSGDLLKYRNSEGLQTWCFVRLCVDSNEAPELEDSERTGFGSLVASGELEAGGALGGTLDLHRHGQLGMLHALNSY